MEAPHRGDGADLENVWSSPAGLVCGLPLWFSRTHPAPITWDDLPAIHKISPGLVTRLCADSTLVWHFESFEHF